MSAAHTQNEAPDSGWTLESLGLSQKELVLAEALQMEYDALSRIKQDRGQDPGQDRGQEQGRGQGRSQETPRICPPAPNTRTKTTVQSIHRPRPTASRNFNTNLPDAALDLPGGSTQTLTPAGAPPAGLSVSKEPLYILEALETNKQTCDDQSDEAPPAVPPRLPITPAPHLSVTQALPLPSDHASRAPPRDINLFTPDGDASKLEPKAEPDFDGLNQSLLRLNDTPPPRPRRDQSGKPVARSKTLPPQVPPRTYLPTVKTNRTQRRVSADPQWFWYELFQVSEERDEEVAAFCHMLDVLRSAFPHSDSNSNPGFVWSPSLSPDLIQGLGVSVKVCVSCEGAREPLCFTCDGSSTVDLLIYQTLCYTQDQEDLDVDQFLMKVCGLDEYLPNSQTLAALEFVQQCLKFDWDVRLKLVRRADINTELQRTKDDDETPSSMNHGILLQERPINRL
ncbi:hypothetical protein WMY93_034053, partial [Mugilogobius chulae]